MFAHEITVPDSYDAPIYHKSWLAQLRQLLLMYCHQRQVSPNEFCEATWILSRTLCEKHPGNKVWIDGPRAGRQTLLRLNTYSWGENERARYHDGCGQCPIQLTCRRLVPSTHYYISGDIHAGRLRDKPPDEEVPF
jgi:hypothetical protein